jgi:Fe2+ transport system protein FeoA
MIRPDSAQFHLFQPKLGSIPSDGMTLDTLVPGQQGTVLQLQGPEALRRRLMEIGFVPGSSVRFVLATPFGDPLVFSLRGTSLALRKSEAHCVLVSL